MATFKLLATASMDAASNTSLTSAFIVPGEMSHYALAIPTVASWCVTATCNVKVQVASSTADTFFTVGYSANPATSTTGITAEDWATGISPDNQMVICEALMFSPGFAKLQFVSTATLTTDILVYGRKFD